MSVLDSSYLKFRVLDKRRRMNKKNNALNKYLNAANTEVNCITSMFLSLNDNTNFEYKRLIQIVLIAPF